MAVGTGGTNPIAVIDNNPMSVRQWIVVVLMVLLNALDGFDVLSSAFASLGISKDWGIDRGSLGIVLSGELIGMGFGSLFLGGLADKMGRKPTMLMCLVIMAIGMYMAHGATAVWPMTLFRVFTGVGIGGMLAATNAVTAESTSKSSRSLAMALYVVGYPLGGIFGGLAATQWLLVDYTWQAVFLFGAITTAAMIPLVMLLVPETPAFHAARRKPDALQRVNRSLRALSQPVVAALPEIVSTGPKLSVTDILTKPGLRKVTWFLALGYMFHTLTFYYILKFAVKIVGDGLADNPLAQAQAGTILTWANVGGAVGGLLFGFLLKKWDIKRPTIAAQILGVAAVAYFGLGHDTLGQWRFAGFMTMFFLNAAIVGFYAALARGFPAYARGTGTGFVLGVGRFGAAGSPLLAGYLFKHMGNDHLLEVSVIMTIGAIASALMVFLVPLRDADRDVEEALTKTQ
ncbi:MAG: MFS transporter [Pseudomonadota bacterium]